MLISIQPVATSSRVESLILNYHQPRQPPLVDDVNAALLLPKLQELVLQLPRHTVPLEWSSDSIWPLRCYAKLQSRKFRRLVLGNKPGADTIRRLQEVVEEVKVRNV